MGKFLHVRRALDVITGIVPNLMVQQALSASHVAKAAVAGNASYTPAKREVDSTTQQQRQLVSPEMRRLKVEGLPYSACKTW